MTQPHESDGEGLVWISSPVLTRGDAAKKEK